MFENVEGFCNAVSSCCPGVLVIRVSREFLPSEDFSIGKKNKYNIREPISMKFIKQFRILSRRICLYEITKFY